MIIIIRVIFFYNHSNNNNYYYKYIVFYFYYYYYWLSKRFRIPWGGIERDIERDRDPGSEAYDGNIEGVRRRHSYRYSRRRYFRVNKNCWLHTLYTWILLYSGINPPVDLKKTNSVLLDTVSDEGYTHHYWFSVSSGFVFSLGACMRIVLYGFMGTHTHISLSRTRRSIKVQFSSLIITHTSATRGWHSRRPPPPPPPKQPPSPPYTTDTFVRHPSHYTFSPHLQHSGRFCTLCAY